MAWDTGGAGDLDLHDTGVCSGRVRMVGVWRGLCDRLLQFSGDLRNGVGPWSAPVRTDDWLVARSERFAAWLFWFCVIHSSNGLRNGLQHRQFHHRDGARTGGDADLSVCCRAVAGGAASGSTKAESAKHCRCVRVGCLRSDLVAGRGDAKPNDRALPAGVVLRRASLVTWVRRSGAVVAAI